MKNLLIITLIFLSSLNYGQEKSEIKPMIQDLIKYTLQADYDNVLDMTYPKLFEVFPKEQMKAMFTQLLNNDDFAIAFDAIDNQIKVSEIQIIEGDKYVWVDYKNAMNIKFHDMTGQDPQTLLGLFESSYPNGTVTWNEEEQKFEIILDSRTLAISDENTNGKWKFLNANDSDRQMLQMLIDEKVINELGL